MTHSFTFTVTVELERESGKFASREEMAEAVIEILMGAEESSVEGLGADGESSYNVTLWEVEEA